MALDRSPLLAMRGDVARLTARYHLSRVRGMQRDGAAQPSGLRSGTPRAADDGRDVTPLATVDGASVYNCDWRDLVPIVEAAGGCDLLCADTPYSAKTQSGHDNGVEGLGDRRPLSYPPFTPADVREFVEAWHPLTRGWFVSVTDDTLAPVWRAEFERVGRYAFAAVPYVAPGSRVRLLGDGPSAWTCWGMVARPRTREAAAWGTLPGAYILPPGQGGAMPVVGGKPIWLGCALVRDYSRPGDLVVDPTCGAGTFGVAALREGRRAIMGDGDEEHAALAAKWIREPWRPAPTEKEAPTAQVRLF